MQVVPAVQRLRARRSILRGIVRAVRARPKVVLSVTVVVLALDVVLPPLVLSLARKPWTYFAVNPMIKSIPAYLASAKPWSEKLDFLWGMALFWVSADGAYGAPEWGFAVDTADVARLVFTALLIGIYVALWLERRDVGRVAGWHATAGNSGGAVGAVAGILGLSTGPCSVMGCGVPVLPVVALVFAGLSSGTLTLLSQLSRLSAAAVIITLLVSIAWLGRQLSPPHKGRRVD